MVVSEVLTLGLMWDALGDEPHETPGVVWSTESTQCLLAIFRTITEDKFPIHEKGLQTAPVTVASASPHNMGPTRLTCFIPPYFVFDWLMTELHYPHQKNFCSCFKTQAEGYQGKNYTLDSLNQNRDLFCISGETSVIDSSKSFLKDRNKSPVKETVFFHCCRLPLGVSSVWIAWAPASSTPPSPAVSGASHCSSMLVLHAK